MKHRVVKATIKDAVSSAMGELEGLAEEVREVVDNASGTNRENHPRIQTLDETASTLEGIQEPDVDGKLGDLEVEYVEQLPRSKRSLSRASRRDNAVSALDACMQVLADLESNDEATVDAAESLREDLERIVDDANAAEFPGMYG